MVTDEFAGFSRGIYSIGIRHRLLVADPDNDLNPRPRLIFCQEDGQVRLRDADGVELEYKLRQGLYLVFQPARVMSISFGVFYAQY